MIAHLSGQLTQKSPVSVVVDVRGVGYEIFVPLTVYYQLPDTGTAVNLHIHTHLREDSLKLFGFLSADDKRIFEALIRISKVGPKMALAILSGMTTQDLTQAVFNHDISRLSAVPGVGRKTAERLALELKDKLSEMNLEPAAASGTEPAGGLQEDAVSALVNLGYKKAQAEQALKKVWRDDPKPTLEELIKDSLNRLS
ncbi:MAG: Holliday junction branch migration protein RuvA [Nitrospinaceae bacterium]|nr:Holliday junction branch migration protein RuvA [Nitrospinaceae bacterium]NIR55206.1 Holliday junction branch migration protein RuvA [Nitrospinaceae bacterium]NIS85633.1 Holliday junction branch migration protein RuvA [Nitrospinaceae bacterium]NIT82478.1 Holliday junction branch migration protein RuvA [Nitrospinaceae bacterium]NIU44683.1 Holliday junction branch migration protein RuvA [Nitrospinaceae bacterium]